MSYNDYDPFARVYNLYWGPHATWMYPILQYLVLQHLPHRGATKGAVLDLCCGSWWRGCPMATGVDGSESMIEIAKRNAPTAEFHVRTCVKHFHVLSCCRPSTASTPRIWRKRTDALSEGGYFGFDLNMARAFGGKGHIATSTTYASCGPPRMSRSASATHLRVGRAGWNRTDLTVAERWYAKDQILDGLRAAGFAHVQAFSADEPIAEGCPTSEGRMFFVARCADSRASPSRNRGRAMRHRTSVGHGTHRDGDGRSQAQRGLVGPPGNLGPIDYESALTN